MWAGEGLYTPTAGSKAKSELVADIELNGGCAVMPWRMASTPIVRVCGGSF